MKVRFEIDCTPEEARAFLALPDVTSVNDHLVAEMKRRLDEGASMLEPEALMKTWTALGGHAQEQFAKLMSAAAAGAAGRPPGAR